MEAGNGYACSRVKGFTVIELLAVAAIISLIASLLIPAVLAARESARRTQCSNNLKQIATASLCFESSFRHLPPGLSMTSEPQLRSWLFDLLPYCEQSPLNKAGLAEYEAQPIPFYHSSFLEIIPTYQCPSDPSSGEIHWTNEASGWNQRVACTNYLGVNGLHGRDKSGVLYADSETRMRDIADGLSNTLLCGERPPSVDFWYGWWYSGMGYDGMGNADLVLGLRERLVAPSQSPHLSECGVDPYDFIRGNMSQCDSLHYWSFHLGGAHFAICDGSVRFFPYESRLTLGSMATRSGNEVVLAE